jgi:hypothetical protein
MPRAALERHPASETSALRGITASVTRTPDRLQVVYVLAGDIGRVRMPAPRPPRSAERLWQHTCCEIFIARDGVPGYQEFNFSPSGEWAAYSFARYREGSALTIPDPRIAVKRAPNRLELSAAVPAGRGKLRIGLSVVVEEESIPESITYWALKHAPGKPDFHHAESFVMELDEVRH